MDEPLCPPWWPKVLWDIHHLHGPGPINFPQAIDDIMASLTIHSMSYLLMNQEVAQQYRNMAEEQVAVTAGRMSQLHEQAALAAQEGNAALREG